jgi:hypothetical protein
MHAKQWMAKAIIMGVIITVLAGCSAPTPTAVPTDLPQPTPNLQATMVAVQTQVVKTFTADLTQNAPTATQVVPTKTAAPTATAIPAATSTPLKPAASPTATLKPQPISPTNTVAVTCQINQVSPSASDTLTPGADFTARWVIVNTGVTTWTQSVFEIMYWSGSRFEKQAKLSMPFDVGHNSNITVVTGTMKAPSAPGTYKSVWAVVKGFQVYCLMPLTIVTK